MKICFLAAANSIHSYRWIKYFAGKGNQVHWISFVPLEFKAIAGVKFYEIKQLQVKVLNVIPLVSKTRNLISDIKPDILHAHYAGIYGLVGALSGYNPLILTIWGSDILLGIKSRMRTILLKYILKKANLITCDAYHMIDTAVKLGADERKIKLIYFGTDFNMFCPAQKNKALRDKLGISNSSAIISLRSLRPIYDIESLINAAPYVIKEIPEARFVIAGSGILQRKLKKMAKDLRVSENILFVGQIAEEELPQYLSSADVYVSSSLSDAGLAASTAEAMACGLPVVITDSGENKRWIQDGKNGFVVPVRTPKILAEKIVYLLKNKEVREKFGRVNREIIIEKDNYFIEMEKMGKIYEEIAQWNIKD